MAKKKYVDVIGITRGKEPEVLATFEERKDANWHVKNTFTEEDKCLVKVTEIKGDKFIKNDIAEDKDVYIAANARMEITDLEKLIIETEEGTLLGLLNQSFIDKKSDLDKLIEGENDASDVKTVSVVYNENTPFPHAKVKKKLEDSLIAELVGEGDNTEEVSEPEEEEEESTESEEVEEEDSEVEEENDESDVEEIEEEVEEETEEEETEEVDEEEVEEEETEEVDEEEEEVEDEEVDEEEEVDEVDEVEEVEEETEEEEVDEEDDDDELDLTDEEMEELEDVE